MISHGGMTKRSLSISARWRPIAHFAEAHFDLAMAYRHQPSVREGCRVRAERAVELADWQALPITRSWATHTALWVGVPTPWGASSINLQDLINPHVLIAADVPSHGCSMGLGDVDAVFSWLDRAYQERSGELVFYSEWSLTSTL